MVRTRKRLTKVDRERRKQKTEINKEMRRKQTETRQGFREIFGGKGRTKSRTRKGGWAPTKSEESYFFN